MVPFLILGERQHADERTQWEYCVATGCIVTLCLAYFVRIISLYHKPLDTRNKLTMVIWWSFFLSILVLQIKQTIFFSVDWLSKGVNTLCEYAVGSFCCFFYVNAILLQNFEWGLLASMIRYQSRHKVQELLVVRDDYKRSEAKKLRAMCFATWFSFLYHLSKILIPCVTLITCSINESVEDCDDMSDRRIHVLLELDVFVWCLIFAYILFCSVKLIAYSWRYSRLEARSHMPYFLINTLGIITGQLLMVIKIILFLKYPQFYLSWSFSSYLDWLQQVFPSLVYLLSKKSEDSFGSFNRLAPQTYSVLQYSQTETDEESSNSESVKKRSRLTYLLINFKGTISTQDPVKIQHPNTNLGASLIQSSMLMMYPCRHGRSRSCEECEMAIELDLNDQIVSNNDIYAETDKISSMTTSEFI